MSEFRAAVIIPAAGSASRYTSTGGLRHKLEEDLAGRPVLHRSVELFSTRPDVASIIVAGPHDPEAFEDFRQRHGPKLGFLGAALCQGGKVHRYESVKAALALVPEDCTHIAVHDAARPCASPRLIERVFEAARAHEAVIPAIPLADTLKRTEPMGTADVDPLDAILGDSGKLTTTYDRVTATLDRAGLVLVQTPQIFRRELLLRAYAQPDLSSTDDAGLVERLGTTVVVVEGESRNLKITHADDLALAKALFENPSRDRDPHKRF